MKPTKLVIKNIGKIAGEMVIEINKPLILFYGEIKQGKTTILNAVRWVCGGEFPADIITHGAKDGEIELHFDGGMIARSFYRAKDDTTKARPVTFVRNGRPVVSPVSEIKRLLNPFLLDQDFLRNKSELERKQYFAELFQVDTSALDTELFNSQRDAQQLRSKIAGYGEIDLTEFNPVDVSELQSKLSKIRSDYDAKADKVSLENRIASESNAARDTKLARKSNIGIEIDRINGEIDRLNKQVESLQSERAGILIPEIKSFQDSPARPETSNIEKQIQDAGAVNVRAEQYRKNLVRHAQMVADDVTLKNLEKRQREIKAEKQAKLKSIGETCGINGLGFDDAGNFIYDGTTAGMISDSQIMRLSSELSGLYPDGFGLDLIDRAESLGKSIFEFIEKAKSENKSILATIVGERPANIPENVGVFVVNDGKIS